MRVERSVLAVPASNWRMIEKGVASGADVVLLDLEDAVAPEAKAEARQSVARALCELDWGRSARAYRVNALDTPYFYRDLIDVVEAAGDRLDLVILPKVNRPEDVYLVDTLLSQIEASRGLTRPIGIEAQIETAEGLVNCERIVATSLRLEAIVFGPGDYAASVRMPVAAIGAPDEWDALYPGHRFHYPMHRILAAGRAAGLRVIDGPYANFRDPEGCRQASRVARALGYDGKWCIHPSQIAIVNEVFSPTEQEVAWARRVVAAYEAAEREGRGAVAIDNTMIDAASIRMARNTLDLARAAGLLE
ncbi:MAG: CoA ester lyase [Thermomicrobiaceae bacterium]|nr:CoA ester lyase [Thermomicrobiaceae bacterium]